MPGDLQIPHLSSSTNSSTAHKPQSCLPHPSPWSHPTRGSREPRILANARRIIIATPTNTSPALNRWRRVGRPTRSLLKVRSKPITTVRDPIKKLSILTSAHRIDSNIKVPVLPKIVDFRRSALIAVLSSAQGNGGGALVDDLESQGVSSERDARGGERRDLVADSAGAAWAASARH
jgi:hypothetical protein